MISQVRWGIIGCGDVTEKKSGPGLQRAQDSTLVAVMRRDAAKAKDYAERHGVPRWYSTVEELLEDAEIDAVYVATPPGSHLELSRQVAKAGKPCYMEKPMARNFTESSEMKQIFEDANLPLFVAYYRRAYPKFLRLKALLDSGSLGALSSVSYIMRRPANAKDEGWRYEVSSSGGGIFVDVGTHLLDILDFLMGPLREVRGCAWRSLAITRGSAAPEDVVSLCFLVGESIAGTCCWNFRACDRYEALEIVGSNGRVVVPDTLNGSDVTVHMADGSTNTWSEDPPSPAVQEPLIQTLVNALISKDVSKCASTAESAMRTAAVVDTVLTNFYGDRAGAFWEKPEHWPVNAP